MVDIDYSKIDPKIMRLIKDELAVIGGCMPLKKVSEMMTEEKKERFRSIFDKHQESLIVYYMTLESELVFKEFKLPFDFHVSIATLFKTIYNYQNKVSLEDICE